MNYLKVQIKSKYFHLNIKNLSNYFIFYLTALPDDFINIIQKLFNQNKIRSNRFKYWPVSNFAIKTEPKNGKIKPKPNQI